MAKARYNVLALIAVSVVEITCGTVPKGMGWPEVLWPPHFRAMKEELHSKTKILRKSVDICPACATMSAWTDTCNY